MNKTFAEIAREQTQAALEKEKALNDEKVRLMKGQEEKYDQEVGENIAKIFADLWKPKITKAAEEGKRTVSLEVSSHNGNNHNFGSYADAMVKHGIPFLQKEGFKVEKKSEYYPRCGSDDPDGNRTYLTLEVSW